MLRYTLSRYRRPRGAALTWSVESLRFTITVQVHGNDPLIQFFIASAFETEG
jgi:hypothetical protein